MKKQVNSEALTLNINTVIKHALFAQGMLVPR